MHADIGESAPTNPFRYGSLALDEAFANREEELRDLQADAINGQDVVIFAPRRYGKSSLVWRAREELRSRGVLCAYVNLMTTATREKLAERLAGAIYESIASPLERAREKAVAPFRGLRISPRVTLDPDGAELSFTFGLGHSDDDVEATLERLLMLPGELAAGRGRKVVLIFDEFQEIAEIDPELPRLLRTVFEQQPETARIYLGSKRHMMERIFNDANEPFWRSAKQVELPLIAPGKFVPFIERRFAETRKEVPAEVVGELVERTGGHPYATQELSYALWERTPFDYAADRDTLAEALRTVLRSEHAHFSLLWDGASSVQRLLLEALATEAGHPFSGPYRRRHGLPAASSVQTAVRALRKRELIAPGADGVYRITEPFLAEWIEAQVVEGSAESG